MLNKILSIEEKIPRPSSLPNGFYLGTWGRIYYRSTLQR